MEKQCIEACKQLLRCPSVPTYAENPKYATSTTINTSSSSIDSIEQEYRKQTIKWLIEFDRKVTKDTNYLAIWYLQMAMQKGLVLKDSNWQLVAASIMLFTSKMNEIYPPSISSILKRCTKSSPGSACLLNKDSLIQMEGNLLNLLGFDIAVQSPFNIVCQILQGNPKDRDECEKLMKIVIYNREICTQYDSETIAYAIVYLISRSTVDHQIGGQFRAKVKAVGQRIYNYYKHVRKNYQMEKQKQKEKEKIQTANRPDSKHLQSGSKPKGKEQPIKQSDEKENHQSSHRKTEVIERCQSYKQIPSAFNQKHLLKNSTNIQSDLFGEVEKGQAANGAVLIRNNAEKKLYRCISREGLNRKNAQSYKNLFFHA